MPRKPESELRRGWTTGACATAAAKAACQALLSGAFPDPVAITLPRGQEVAFALAWEETTPDSATAGIIKDAGDDPDVTHQALVLSTLRAGIPGAGVVFRAGPGVGTVTKPGLPIPPGEPAINPVPRRMIGAALAEVAGAAGQPCDFEVEISIPGGEALAEKTWNPRLGILGGLSILGTTGIVVPFSCAAWIHSIHRGIDVARATGLRHVAGCTGSTSEATVQKLYGLPDVAMLDMGDFAGGLLKYLAVHPLPRLTLAGGFAKISKLAAGHLDLHSGRSQVDFDRLSATLEGLGADAALLDEVRQANTAKQVLDLAQAAGLRLADAVAGEARAVACARLPADTTVEVLIVDRAGVVVGHADGIGKSDG